MPVSLSPSLSWAPAGAAMGQRDTLTALGGMGTSGHNSQCCPNCSISPLALHGHACQENRLNHRKQRRDRPEPGGWRQPPPRTSAQSTLLRPVQPSCMLAAPQKALLVCESDSKGAHTHSALG